MAIYKDTLDKVSGGLFFLGFFTSKLKDVPFFLLSKILDVISIAAYLIGYIAWYIGALYSPDRPKDHEEWYGFATFKQQYKVAAILGTLATIMCIFMPLVIIPTAWIYTISNLIWAISEYHKRYNPFLREGDGHDTDEKQSTYLRYAILVTCSSSVAAIASTLVLLFPPITFIVVSSSSVLGAGLTIASLYYWGKFIFSDFAIKHSYTLVSDGLSEQLDEIQADRIKSGFEPENPAHYPSLFVKKKQPFEDEVNFDTDYILGI